MFGSPSMTSFVCDFCGRTFHYPFILAFTGGIECSHCGKRIGITGKDFLEEVIEWAKEDLLKVNGKDTSGIVSISLRPKCINSRLLFSNYGKVIEKTFLLNHYRVDGLRELLPDTLRTNFNNYKQVEVAQLFREDDNINIEYTIDI